MNPSPPSASDPTTTARQEALRAYAILDTGPEAHFDELTRLAAFLCATPFSCISLVDRERLFFKSAHGLLQRGTPRPEALCGLALQQEKVFQVRDAAADPRMADHPLVRDEPRIRFYAAAPLITPEGVPIGVLNVMDRIPRELDPNQQEGLTILAHQVMAQMELAVRAVKDPLTGLFNRRYMNELLYREIKNLERKGRPLSLLVVDVDRCQEFNESYGFGAGDALLRRVGRLLRKSIREGDLACRLEGDAFAVMLPEASLEAAITRAEELRALVGRQQIETSMEVISGITISVGISAFPIHGDNEESLLRKAFQALKTANSQGYNQVVVATLDAPHPILRG